MVLILSVLLVLVPLSSSAEPSLVFTAASPGLAELADISVDGDLSLSLQFRTGASQAQLVYLREQTSGHVISLSLSDGALHLQVHPDTLIVPGEDVRVDDQEWHSLYFNVNGGKFRYIAFKLDDLEMFQSVSDLPLLSNAQYQTWLGGLPPSLSEERETGYVGCIRDIRVLDTDRDLQEFEVSGVTVGQCEEEEVGTEDHRRI